MKPSGQSNHPHAARNSRSTIRGFTAPGVTLTLLAVALAGYIAISEFKRYQHRVMIDRFVSDLRTLAETFENYRQKKGTWPPATNPDIRIPLGMETVLATTAWKAGPPFGGTYEWQPPFRPAPEEKESAVRPAFIAVTAFSPNPPLPLTPDDLRSIDAKLDDGNLTTGRFRTGFNGWPVYLLDTGAAPAPKT